MNEPQKYTPSITPIARPDVVSQSTAVEQTRAVAQVQAAMITAKQHPRNLASAIAQMEESTRHMALAERAFFRFPRAGQQVSGPSIHLARELARCWGNVDYGIVELFRDDRKHESEMLAYATDLETNTRTSTTFISPHRMDTKKGSKDLTEVRDLYENNANVGARRLREMIFNLLPVWFREQAIANCNATLKDGGGVPLPQRITQAINAFDSIGVRKAKLEGKIGRPSAEWTPHDIAQLLLVFQSIDRGESSVGDEFPAERLSAEDLVSQAPKSEVTSTPVTSQPKAKAAPKVES